MEIQKDTIYQLLMLKLTDSLKESDEGYINSLIESEPEVYQMWIEIQADFATPGSRQALQEFDTTSVLSEIRDEMIRRKQRRVLKRNLLIYAVTMTIGISAFVYVIVKDQRKPDYKMADLSRKVRLELDNEEEIDLSNNGAVTLQKLATGNFTTGTIIVPAGKEYQLTLNDGTDVRLNSGSKLLFPFTFSGLTREVTISGEAFIKVAANVAKPFIVHTQHTTVQVLGTSFNVNSYDSGKVTVSLVEGAVKMINSTNEVLLKPGYQATSDGQLQQFDSDSELAWLQDQYIFSHERIADIAPVLQRWYDVQIVFDNPTAADKLVAGHIMRSDDIATVLKTLKKISDIEYYQKDNIIHIK